MEKSTKNRLDQFVELRKEGFKKKAKEAILPRKPKGEKKELKNND